ncbi:hypothetical protein NEHOM01_1791 [Nematocida homosporus]|uniref:uncharacterized protein n=1 Tax=Nematocida homosporus TaxID=1912981 RepID=UPI00221FE249|nr:uncharacterized protein NEHOM01_1791 [Nematocida homosporus]KAI5186907.1 hypothetical protein NEHOM01_1791 [Nematocida homosporus]
MEHNTSQSAFDLAIATTFPHSDHQQHQIKLLLKKYLLKQINKSELEQHLHQAGITPTQHNTLILRLLATAWSASKEKTLHPQQCIPSREVLNIKEALPESFLLEIKETLDTSHYLSKSFQQYSFFRRTPENLSMAINGRPQLIALFSTNYNILCSKIQKILSIKDLQNRLKKGSFEYILNEQIGVTPARCAYECLKHYLKEVIGKALNKETNKIDKTILLSMMFGNIKGIYLLYEDYPTTTTKFYANVQ